MSALSLYFTLPANNSGTQLFNSEKKASRVLFFFFFFSPSLHVVLIETKAEGRRRKKNGKGEREREGITHLRQHFRSMAAMLIVYFVRVH